MIGSEKFRGFLKHPGFNFGGGGDGGGTSTTVPQIPVELKPLANLYVQQATDIAQTPFQTFTGQRFADLTPTQNLGIELAKNRALSGSPTMDFAESNLNQFMGGGRNPYLEDMYKRASDSALNAVNSNFSAAGRYGSGAHAGAVSRGLTDLATSMYGGAYENDQARRMQAIGMAPTFGNAAYQDAGQLLNVGGIQQQAAQNPLDFAYEQFSQGQDYPFKQLQATGGIVQGNMGSTTTSTQSSGGK